MASIDSRIVFMKLTNRDFINNAKTTLSVLQRLKSATGLGGLQKATSGFSMQNVVGETTRAQKGFLALATVAATAISNITNRVVNLGLSMAKDLTIGPVMQGFGEYELKLGSIQTILANTARHGTTLKTVNSTLNDLNTYADKTIYNFAEMTKNIGLFTNAGIKVEDASDMIQGFSNVAAASGTSAQGAAGAAYQLSQALSAGTIRLMDWRSLTNVGMGNKNMQEGIIDLADAMGAFEGTSITAKEAADDFNGSLEKKWLSADVMEKYLKIMAGKVTPAQMKALGLTEKQVDRFIEQAKTAEEAATKVRTWTQLWGTLQEAVGSGWAQTFEMIIGDFDEATELFTGISNTIGGLIDQSSKARNKVVSDWKKAGGRDNLIAGLKAGFESLMSILRVVGAAFREVFPPVTGQRLAELTRNFRMFMERLRPSTKTLAQLQRIFRGLFSVLSIGVKIVKAIGGFFLDMFGAIFSGSGGFLELAANVGDFFFELNKGIGPFEIFSGLSDKVVAGIKKLGKAFTNLVTGDSALAEFFGVLADSFGNIGGKIKEWLSGIEIDWSLVFGGLGAGAAGGIFLTIRKFFKNLNLDDLSGGLLSSISDSLEQLTGVLQGVQQNLKASALLKIAAAIGILALSLLVLSTIEYKKLIKATTAVSVSMGLLVGALQMIGKVTDPKTAASLPLVAGGLVLLATAVLILAAAFKVFETVGWEGIAKGLVGTAAGLAMFVAAAKLLGGMNKRLILAGGALLLMSLAILALSAAIKQMSKLQWDEIARGLGGTAASLIIFSGALRMMPKNMAVTATSILILAAAMVILSQAVERFGSMQLGELAKGLFAIGASIVILAGALRLMPAKRLLSTSAALILVGIALQLVASAVQEFGSMTIEEIAKGLITLAGALLILAVAAHAMSGTLAGAAAMVIVAAAVALLVPPFKAFASMSWSEIIKALVGLAAALTVVGIAAAIFGASAPLMLAGGAALLVVGLGLAAIGLAALAFAKAWDIAVRAAGAGSKTMRDSLKAVTDAIPGAMRAFGKGIVEFIKVIGNSQREFVKAFSSVLSAMLDAGIRNVPKMGKLFRALLDEALKTTRRYFPQFVDLGWKLVNKMLDGLNDNMPKITRKGTEIVVKLINGIANHMDRVVRAGVNLIVAFLRGIGNNYQRITSAGTTLVIKLINGASNNMGRVVTAGVTAIVKFLNGVSSNLGRIITAGANLVIRFINGISSNMQRIVNAGMQAIIRFINGLTSAVNRYAPQIRSAGLRLAAAIADGFTGGLASKVGGMIARAKGAVSSAISAAKSVLKIGSPSKVFYEFGQWSAEGLALGIGSMNNRVESSAEDVGSTAVNALKDSIRHISDVAIKDMDLNPIITPLLDLDRLRKEAKNVPSLLDSKSLLPSLTISRADLAAADYDLSMREAAAWRQDQVTPKIEFVQNNNSPKALSTVEIYRNTRSQLSLAKEALRP